ncbi:hypothetical protein E2320_012785 [Naja naja]|nr:hypothetical protein E2320_012785 [Naja naja]
MFGSQDRISFSKTGQRFAIKILTPVGSASGFAACPPPTPLSCCCCCCSCMWAEGKGASGTLPVELILIRRWKNNWISTCGFKPAWPNACAGGGAAAAASRTRELQEVSSAPPPPRGLGKEAVGPSVHLLKPIAFLNTSLLPFVCKCTLLFPTQGNSAFFDVPGRGL